MIVSTDSQLEKNNVRERKSHLQRPFRALVIISTALFLIGSLALSQAQVHPNSILSAGGGAVRPSVAVAPHTATVEAGTQQTFTATVSGLANKSVSWQVNGIAGGNAVLGTISNSGVYTAPAIDPGMSVSVRAVSKVSRVVTDSATVTVLNPDLAALNGINYADAVKSWHTVLMPWISSLVGLQWDESTRTWSAVPGWAAPAQGIGPTIYWVEPALRPLTNMAVAKHDIPLLEELASFHLALLRERSTTIGSMLQNAPRNAVVFINGADRDRTFAWIEPYGPQVVRIRESQLSEAQYVSVASGLLRAIAALPAAERTAPLKEFLGEFSHFLVSEQLVRLLYGRTWWGHWQNPKIGNPVVTAWKFLASNPKFNPKPLYQVGLSDAELWLIADAAQVLQADATAPELSILNDATRAQLRDAVQSGAGLIGQRCRHATARDGSDVLYLFTGDWDDYSDYAYSAVTTPQLPTAPAARTGISFDSSHASRFPILFRILYETRAATGVAFPTKPDLVALTNTYVHLTLDTKSDWPDFNNYLDGWDGWFRAHYAPDFAGYPPHEYCDAMRLGNCENPGTVQGWGQLSAINPKLAAVEQRLVDLALDDSAGATQFKDQHYYYGGPYRVSGGVYPWLLIYIAGENAQLLQ